MPVFPKVRLLIVGLNAAAEQEQFMSYMKGLEARDITWWDGCQAVPSFGRALRMLTVCPALELVHVYQGEGYVSLKRDCTALARILAAHPKHPWLNLNGAPFNFLRPALKEFAHVRIGTFEDVAGERWQLFGPNQCRRIDQQF